MCNAAYAALHKLLVMIMKKNIKRVYIFEIILLIFIIMFKAIAIKSYREYSLIINTIFWLLITLFGYITFGFSRDKNYLKPITIKIVVTILLLYFVSTYLMGFFIGFGYSHFDNNILVILKNIYPYVIIFTCMEIFRYIILKNCTSKKEIIILTIEYIALNIIMGISGKDLSNAKNIFVITSTIIVPIIANESMYSYVTYNVSFAPSLIYRLVIELYAYFMPFLPAIGDYLSAIFSLILPFVIYYQVRKEIKYKDAYHRMAKKTLRRIVLVIMLAFISLLAALTSGFFKYHIIAIVSNSMKPTYKRGDAVIIEKVLASEVNEGDILAFDIGTGIITHRVVKIKYDKGVYTFITKGDNNETIDALDITNENVYGVVKYALNNAGYPTVWIHELFERR